ncbi:MAG: hypothetical protein FK733_05970 [Asgard group archaeon]|nr:hypothetical protein [Asgard group archaeon]
MEFKTYEESRLDDHIELVNDVIKHWEWISWYPTKEQLKAVYSREGFTPDTRHYLYDNDLLVGFLSTAVEELTDGVQHGSIHRLFVRQGYEHVEDKIMKKSIDELKARDVKVIRTNLKPGMGNLEKIYERWGFGEKTIMDYSVIFLVEDYVKKDYQKPEYLVDINFETNKELLIDAICSDGSRSKEDITNRIESLLKRDAIFGAVVAKKENSYLAYSILYNGNKPERSFMSPITILGDGNEKLIKDIFYFSVGKANEANKVYLYHQIANFDLKDHYNDFNLKFVPSYKYILKL